MPSDATNADSFLAVGILKCRMIKDNALSIIIVIIFIVPIGVFMPAFIGASTASNQENVKILTVNEPQEVGKYIEIEAVEVTENNATFSVTDTQNAENSIIKISENSTEILDYANGDITLTLESVHSYDRVALLVEYPSEYGWSENEKRVGDSLTPMTTIPIIVIVFLVVYAVLGVGGDS